MARTHEYGNQYGRKTFVSSISSVDSTVPDFDVQPAYSNDVQSIYPDYATVATSSLPTNADPAYALDTCTINTLLSDSTMSCHPFSTIQLPCFCRMSISTSS